jgi:hypothetical protein
MKRDETEEDIQRRLGLEDQRVKEVLRQCDERIKAKALAHVQDFGAHEAMACESPVEFMLCRALFDVFFFDLLDSAVSIRPQVEIDRYRVDFVVQFTEVATSPSYQFSASRFVQWLNHLEREHPDVKKLPDLARLHPPKPINPDLKVVVECDGHEFHERTKEQARADKSRDRELTAMGYTVLHFTGSEIHADPWKCAREVYRVLIGYEHDDSWVFEDEEA